MEVDEERRLGVRVLDGLGRSRPHATAHLVDAPPPLGGVEDGARAREGRLAAAEERLVSEEAPVRDPHDRLVGHPERLDRAREDDVEADAVPGAGVIAVEHVHRVALGAREPRQVDRALEERTQMLDVERLGEVAEGPELDGGEGGAHVGRPGEQDDGHVEIALAHRAEARRNPSSFGMRTSSKTSVELRRAELVDSAFADLEPR